MILIVTLQLEGDFGVDGGALEVEVGVAKEDLVSEDDWVDSLHHVCKECVAVPGGEAIEAVFADVLEDGFRPLEAGDVESVVERF